MKIFLALVIILLASPAFAVCTNLDRVTETEMCMHQGGPVRCIQFSELSTGNRTSWANQLSNAFQAIMDRRELLTGMVSDEEARFNPPHDEGFYLGDADGVHHHNTLLDTFLISRCDVVTVTWDGSRFFVRVQNTSRNHTPEGELIQ